MSRTAFRSAAVTAVLVASCLVGCTTTSTSTPSRPDANAAADGRPPTPTDVRTRSNIRLQLAVGYYQDGKYSFALDELKQALALDPNSADAHTVLALVYNELHEDAKAEAAFQRALQLDPGNSDLNNNYGWYLCQHGREKDSLGYFETALRNPLYTQKAKPLQNSGVCAAKMGDAVASEEFFRRSFEIDPTGAVAAYNLANIYYGRQDYTRARFYVAQVNNGAAPTPVSLWLGIRVERRLGNKTNVAALENQLERLFPDSREAQLQKRGNYAD